MADKNNSKTHFWQKVEQQSRQVEVGVECRLQKNKTKKVPFLGLELDLGIRFKINLGYG